MIVEKKDQKQMTLNRVDQKLLCIKKNNNKSDKMVRGIEKLNDEDEQDGKAVKL
jgi:hypothetical protein